MIKSRKLSIFIFSLLLVVTSIIFASCGKLDYSKTYLSSSIGDYVSLYVDDEQELSITIQNPVDEMNRGITFSQSNPLVANITQIANQNNTTSYSIVGLSGGKTIVDFISIEGRKSISITIDVKEYSDFLEKGENSLYLSKTKSLQPTSSDFKFKESSTERNLEFYFYGKTSVNATLTEDDILSNDGYVNNFVSVEIFSIENNDYLIFTDKDGLLHTLGHETIVAGSNNVRYEFIDVTKTDNGFLFDNQNATSVNLGNEFTFMAKYFNSQLEESEGNGNIFCERKFNVLKNIEKDDFSHEYGYKIEGVDFVAGNEMTSYKIDQLKNGNVTLIPQYSTIIYDNPILIGKKANYLTAYLQLELPQNDLLNFDFNTRDTSFANTTLLDTLQNGDKTTYYFAVNCSIGNARQTVIDFNFWYEGFKNSNDSNVNFTYSIPVDIRIIPVTLLINNIDFEQMNTVFKFYDSYATENSGWQEFNFSVVPEGAEYDVLKIDLTASNLQIKYKNIVYRDIVVEINDLKEPVFIKGVENAPLTNDVNMLPVQMDFNIIQQDSLETSIQYEILKGVRELNFETENFENGIALERYQDEVLFDDIFADAEFYGMSFDLESGKDVVRFRYEDGNVFNVEGDKYYLNINLLPRDVGSGTYLVTLDNGISTYLTVEVREGLNSLSLSTSNEDNSVRFKEDKENYSMVYLLNRNSQSYFDAKIIANDDINSTAIIDIDTINNSSSIFTRVGEDGKYLIYSSLSGRNELIFNVKGYQISNFVKREIVVEYIVDLITYELAEDMFVYKVSDAFNEAYPTQTNANYVNVYAGTNNIEIKQAKFEVAIKNPNAFLFQSQSQDELRRGFVAETFKLEFLYFESDNTILKDGKRVNRIFYSPSQSNIFTIANLGTFDAEKLIFTSMGSGEVKLIAHIMQYNKLYSFPININILPYEEVQKVTLQDTVDSLEFSAFKSERSLIAYPTNPTATNSQLVALIEGGQISRNKQIYKVLDKNSVKYIESDGKTHITFKVNDDFLKAVVTSDEDTKEDEVIVGNILIVAKDWLDANGELRSGYTEYASIRFEFTKGTESSRYIIENADDLNMVRKNLSSHFKIKTTIDISNVSLPLGELKGSIIGTSEYAELTGLNISEAGTIGNDSVSYYGLFTSIADGGYLEYVKFSGKFSIKTDKNSYIGFVAGINNGRLTNIGASISASSISVSEECNVYFGGLVGENNGLIIQDFTKFEKGDFKGLSPNIVMMNDFVDINYALSGRFERSIGGVVGINNGEIRKIDSDKLTFSGYSNYMVYARIKTSYNGDINQGQNYQVHVGALAGQNKKGRYQQNKFESKIIGGYKNENDEFVAYLQYSETGSGFKAGKGIIVGGEIWGHGYVGGVVGKNDETSLNNFCGITARTFVRGYNVFDGDHSQLTLLSYLSSSEDFITETENSAYAIQAVDDGKVLEESAMAVLYSSEELSSNFTLNNLGFGSKIGNQISVLSNTNVLSYINRNYLQKPDENSEFFISNSNRANYYGDFVIVGESSSSRQKILIHQEKFGKGNLDDLSIEQRFNNLLVSEKGSSQIFYTYYFDVASVIGDDIASLQAQIDLELNRHTSTSNFYPFVAKGEMTFVSKSPDILTIDQMGKITVNGTGRALIIASSILNSNESLNFYIYVVNYFNSEALEENNENKTSVVYPTISSTLAINKSTIELRGNNSTLLYVIPNYQANIKIDQESSFVSDDRGFASFKNVHFYLAQNTDLTASVKIYKNESEFYEENDNPLDVSVVGQIITIRRKDTTEENNYNLYIQTILRQVVDGDIYTISTNKTLKEAVVDYKFGALSLLNKNYNDVPIRTSGMVADEITLISTDENEGEEDLLYYVIGLDDKHLQGNIDTDKIMYQLSGEEELFIVKFIKTSSKDLGNGTFEHKFRLEISINTGCQLYKDRYEKEIYGKYIFHIRSSSNSAISRNIEIFFEKTGVQSIVIDNYTSLSENQSGLTTSSELAYPGEAGMLILTIKPSDSDFDFIMIENDAENFNNNRAVASFSLLARVDGQTVKMFDEDIIAGATIGNGYRITLQEIIDAYAKKDNYKNYDGVIYIKYNLSSSGVSDLSKTKINVSVWKDGSSYYTSSKDLTVKLQNYVAVEIDGKEPISTNQNGIYQTYEVARGLKYKLNINSYGFRQDNISITSNNSIGKVTFENGDYYLNITDGTIDYASANNEIILTTKAIQNDGDTLRSAESKTKVIVFEYVFNYNNELDRNSDIVKGMGEGIINVQVGSKLTLGLDIYDYIEYNSSISGVRNKIEEFISELERVGKWEAVTNLISDNQPDYKMAGSTTEPRKKYQIGFDSNNVIMNHSNYYFNSEGLNIIPKRTHQPVEKFYYFDFTVSYDTSNGVYVVKAGNEQDSARKIETTFIFNVYSSSSEESPIPIYTYSDLLNMQSGGYYILLNDITLPSVSEEGGAKAFSPLNGNFASFDGNGHAINFAGVYDMGNLSEIGLFHTLNAQSIVKNLVVNYTTLNDGSDLNTDINDSVYALYGLKTVKFITTADSFVFGTIAAQNLGIISNCRVYSDVLSEDKFYLAVKADNAITNNSYVGGLVGYNSGFITNCGVSINAKVPFNLAGLVAQNNGKIAGCYFEKGILLNNSQYDQHIGGIAITNSAEGQIITSYVSGRQTNTNLFSKDNQSQISSTLAGAGFVYNNAGLIKDCYSDIDLSKTSSDMAGFVFRNGGTIRNSFSLSILRSNTTASAGFAKENIYEGSQGVFENCYYLYNLEAADNLSEAEKDKLTKEGHYMIGENNVNINVSLYDVTFDGVMRLTQGQFADVETYFKHYSYDENVSTKAVWFFSQGFTSETYIDYIPTTEKIILPGDEGNSQSNTVYREELMTFGLNRLSLVSPNVRALSVRNFDRSEVDEVTENITYFYTDDMNSPSRGSIHNPRLIYNSNTMENEILNQTTSNNLNMTNYRLISDVSYVDFNRHSNLFTVIYAGNFEGNGMEISSIGLVYMQSRTNGGLFSQIGYSASRTGSVKNLTISPKEVVFNNTNNVGTLAGTLKYGYIYDITIDARSNNLTSVAGLNFVGGVIGKAVSAFEAKDIYSNADIWSVYTPSNDATYIENSSNDSGHSYAGGLIGFVGKGKVHNAHVYDVSTITGSKVGLAFGGIGNGANVEYVFPIVTKNLKLRSNMYAGYVVGEQSGNLSYAHIPDNGAVEYSFVGAPKSPLAVGGIAGKFSGGRISNVSNEQDFSLIIDDNQEAVENVGGIIGVVNAEAGRLSVLEDSVLSANIIGAINLGGAVGTVHSALRIDGVAVKSERLSLRGRQENPKLGGIVAFVRDNINSSIEIRNSYCTANLDIETYTMGISSTAHAGGLIAFSAKIPALSYCYTTSIVQAQVYDVRALGSNQDFGEIFSDDNEGNTDQNNRNLYSYGHIITKNAYNVDQIYYDNVYYFGSSVSGNDADNNPVYKANKSFAQFKSRAKNAKMSFNLNNYGMSSIEYIQMLGLEVSDTTIDRLNNLYGNIYQIKQNFDGQESDYPTEIGVGTELHYNTSKDLFTTGKDGVRIIRNTNTTESYIYTQVNKDTEEDDKIWTMTITKNLLQNILFKGSDKESYRYTVNVSEDKTEIGYLRVKDNVFIKESEFDKMNISLHEVWKTSFNSLTTLYIEDDFNWTNKL